MLVFRPWIWFEKDKERKLSKRELFGWIIGFYLLARFFIQGSSESVHSRLSPGQALEFCILNSASVISLCHSSEREEYYREVAFTEPGMQKRKCDFTSPASDGASRHHSSFYYLFQLLTPSEKGGTFRLRFLLRRKVRGRLRSPRSRQCPRTPVAQEPLT
jgi:hypothetical protein